MAEVFCLRACLAQRFGVMLLTAGDAALGGLPWARCLLSAGLVKISLQIFTVASSKDTSLFLMSY